MGKKKKRLRIALSVILVLGAIGALSGLNSFSWRKLVELLSGFSTRWVALAIGLSVVQVFWQILRYWVIFRPAQRPPALDLFRVTAIGQLLNALAPLRSGDAYRVLRLVTLGSETKVILATALAERVADTASLFLLAGLATAQGLAHSLQPLLAWAAAISVLLVPIFFWIRGFSRLRPARKVLKDFCKTIAKDLWSSRFVVCFAVATVTWLLDAGTLVWSAKAGGAHLTLMQAMACIFALNIGTAIPLTVANVGFFEAALVFALGVYGVGLEQAVGIATVEHAVKIAGLFVCLALTSYPKNRK